MAPRIEVTGSSRNPTSAPSKKRANPALSNKPENASEGQPETNPSGIDWTSMPTDVLHAYRHAYRLDVPSSFRSSHNHLVLHQPGGIGKQSPTMARKKSKQKVAREKLALEVRKDFNAAAVNETDVITSFLYSVRNKNKHFKMKFPPGKDG